MSAPDLEQAKIYKPQSPRKTDGSGGGPSSEETLLAQKVFAEIVGTYFLIFIGCGSFVVNKKFGSITFLGMCAAWGFVIMIMAYSVGHVSSAHLNPAVTITLAIFNQFPYKQVPVYVAGQMLGSIFGSATLYLLFEVEQEYFFGTVPKGSSIRSLVLEIITSFLLMFVICGVATDNRSAAGVAGVAIGMTIFVDVMIAGQVSGASMNPARTLGPAIVMHVYTRIWIYLVGPLCGTILGGFAYNVIRVTEKPLRELPKSPSKSPTFSRTFTSRR